MIVTSILSLCDTNEPTYPHLAALELSNTSNVSQHHPDGKHLLSVSLAAERYPGTAILRDLEHLNLRGFRECSHLPEALLPPCLLLRNPLTSFPAPQPGLPFPP